VPLLPTSCRRASSKNQGLGAYCFEVIEIRRCATEADEFAALEIYNAVRPQDAITIDEVNSFKSGMLGYVDHLAWIDGSAAGSAVGAIRPQRPDRVFALVTVLAEHRRHGVGSALYQVVSKWAAELGLDTMETWVEEDDAESIAFAQRRGFAEIERNGRMVLDLAAVGELSVEAPAGIEIVTWAERPDVEYGLYEVACEANRDVPGSEQERMEPFGDWLAHEMRGSGDLPEATFVALAGDEVVGYAKFSLTAARPLVAAHDLTGVKRAWRGRGIAGALKRAQIAWAKREGYERLETANEMRNEPIRRLNARLGYRPAPGRIFLLGPLAR
jgi:GNAT superfamily N-acetyltransferase